jgi:hypothetical protein
MEFGVNIRLVNGGIAPFECVQSSQKSRIELNRRMQAGGETLGMAEHFLIVLLLRRTIDTRRIKKRSGARHYGFYPKATETTFVF